MHPLAAAMVSTGVITESLAAVFAVPRITKSRPPSEASKARCITADGFFHELEKSKQKKKEIQDEKEKKRQERMEKERLKLEEKERAKQERAEKESANQKKECGICGVQAAESSKVCGICNMLFHTSCLDAVRGVILGDHDTELFCVNCNDFWNFLVCECGCVWLCVCVCVCVLSKLS